MNSSITSTDCHRSIRCTVLLAHTYGTSPLSRAHMATFMRHMCSRLVGNVCSADGRELSSIRRLIKCSLKSMPCWAHGAVHCVYIYIYMDYSCLGAALYMFLLCLPCFSDYLHFIILPCFDAFKYLLCTSLVDIVLEVWLSFSLNRFTFTPCFTPAFAIHLPHQLDWTIKISMAAEFKLAMPASDSMNFKDKLSHASAPVQEVSRAAAI